jgi:hypothetical protein
MKNKFLPIILAAIITIIPQTAYSQEKSPQTPISIQTATKQISAVRDPRIKILRSYLEKYDSPLAPYASEFVAQADKYNLDWKLVAAIAGTESTYGKAIPYNSYNAWGWGVYGDNVIRFSSWNEGIATISQGLRERYMDAWGGENIYEIGHVYAASPVWAQHVQFYMNQIHRHALSDTKNTLSLSL